MARNSWRPKGRFRMEARTNATRQIRTATAPPDKVIRINFTKFDTEPRRDLVYFFNGAGTQDKIMAIFSGNHIPPVLTTWSNKVLLWFVTDGQHQFDGWQMHYQFVDPPGK